MIKDIEFKAQSSEWLDFRKKYITGTEIASLFGLNPYKSANDLALEKTAGVEFPFTDNSFVKIGRVYEDAIINQVGGIAAGDKGNVKLYYDEEVGISCTLDGIYQDVPLECKCMYYNSFVNKHKGTMPPHYMLQLITQMHMLGKDVGYFGVLLYCPENFAKADGFDPHFSMYPLIIESITLYRLEVKDIHILMETVKEAVEDLYDRKSAYRSKVKRNKIVKEFLKDNVTFEKVEQYE